MWCFKLGTKVGWLDLNVHLRLVHKNKIEIFSVRCLYESHELSNFYDEKVINKFDYAILSDFLQNLPQLTAITII